jgi:SAM-dependent methyltransferase
VTKTEYVLGHSAREFRRLRLQGVLAEPITIRLLQSCGLKAGMRVLDIGTGAGDVAMLAAERVGSSGCVVAIDGNAEAIKYARDRAEAAGLRWLDFRVGSLDETSDLGSFDLVVGRLVLHHQSDEVAFIQKAASFTRSGGLLGFIEPGYNAAAHMSTPAVPLYEECFRLCADALTSVGAKADTGLRLVELFHKAGLDEPELACDVLTGGPNSQMVEWIALTLQSMLPQLESIGATTAARVEIDTLQERLLKAASVAPSQLSLPPFISAWTRVLAQ